MKEEIIGYGGTAISAVLTATQAEDIFRYIQLSLTILVAIVTLVYTIYKWYKRAKQDGKITSDEVEDLVDDIKEIADDVKDNIDKEDKK